LAERKREHADQLGEESAADAERVRRERERATTHGRKADEIEEQL
jgi:hypothetical protein